MRNLKHLDEYRKPLQGHMGDEYNGLFRIKLPNSLLTFTVVASNGNAWDHVSVSTDNRCPRWNEMQAIKEMFFEDDEVVMQLHPKKEDYINQHPYCLHMWRHQYLKIPTPPKYMVGLV